VRALGLSETLVAGIWKALLALVALAGVALAAAQTADAQEKRIALVVGNGKYDEINSLTNPINDARLMRSTLQGLGFEVIYRENVDKRSMEKTIGEFASKLYDAGRDTVSLVYYAGHGVQSNGENFLLPTDTPLRRETDLRLNAVRAGDILAQMEGAQSRVKIVILDACRDNPFELSFRSLTRSGGLADMRMGNAEFFIAYAATSGNVAWDGDGDAKNSPYALALAKYLGTADTDISEAFRLIRNEVANVTRGRQLPEARTTLRSQFFFNPKTKKPLMAQVDLPPEPPVTPPTPVAAPSPTPSPTSSPVVAANAGDTRSDPLPSVHTGAPIKVSGLTGTWCDVARAGSDFRMKISSNRWEQLFSGHSNVYVVRNISQLRDDTLQMTSTQEGETVISEFGEFGADGKSMSYLRQRKGSGDWTDFNNRRYKKC
jgi:hypothetical protein